MEDIYAVNGGEDIAVTLTEDDSVGIIQSPAMWLVRYTETLIITYEKGQGWYWYVEGVNDRGDHWQDESLLASMSYFFNTYRDVVRDAIRKIRRHVYADDWRRGIRTLEYLLVDESLDPRTVRRDEEE